MGLVHSKTNASTSLLSVSAQKEDTSSKVTLSFSELLRGATAAKEDKVVQNGTLILSLSDAKDEVTTVQSTKMAKGESLLSLLRGKEKAESTLEKTPLELNPKITATITPSELKELINSAKQYLKDKITSMEGFKKSEIATLPKTLKGLVQVAQTVGIDVSKITLEEVQSSLKFAKTGTTNIAEIHTIHEQENEKEINILKLLLYKENIVTKSYHSSIDSSISTAQAVVPFTNIELTKVTPNEIQELINSAKQYLKDKITSMEGFKKSEIATLPKTLKGLVQVAQTVGIDVSKITLEEVQSSLKFAKTGTTNIAEHVEIKQENKSKQRSDSSTLQEQTKTVTKESVKVLDTGVTERKINTTAKLVKTEVLKESEPIRENQTRREEQVKVNEKIKATPLFKAQIKSEISTEQIVNARSSIIEAKTAKEKTNETLKLLLRGENETKEEPLSLKSISVATLKALSPSPTTHSTQSLESLLKGETQTQESNSSQGKLDGLNVAKTNSLELKLNEAKQMVKYLSQDVKTAIEDYKSPFTRVKVQLNPQRLGEVDLTVVQRGKNLHISLSSNNSAINTLAMNVNELKMQLVNNGINNASFNFSNNPQSQDGSASQQQNSHQQREQASKEYNYFQSEEETEEIVSSLEIVVPHYA